ncbi:hypothetical protein [Escherichia phage vB_EcoM_EP57]|nr:hypothetical protein [Escherichia phage vB_EcoM_EP57]
MSKYTVEYTVENPAVSEGKKDDICHQYNRFRCHYLINHLIRCTP